MPSDWRAWRSSRSASRMPDVRRPFAPRATSSWRGRWRRCRCSWSTRCHYCARVASWPRRRAAARWTNSPRRTQRSRRSAASPSNRSPSPWPRVRRRRRCSSYGGRARWTIATRGGPGCPASGHSPRLTALPGHPCLALRRPNLPPLLATTLRRLRRLASLDDTLYDELRFESAATIPAIAVTVVGLLSLGLGGWLWWVISDLGETGTVFVKTVLLGTVFGFVGRSEERRVGDES